MRPQGPGGICHKILPRPPTGDSPNTGACMCVMDYWYSGFRVLLKVLDDGRAQTAGHPSVTTLRGLRRKAKGPAPLQAYRKEQGRIATEAIPFLGLLKKTLTNKANLKSLKVTHCKGTHCT